MSYNYYWANLRWTLEILHNALFNRVMNPLAWSGSDDMTLSPLVVGVKGERAVNRKPVILVLTCFLVVAKSCDFDFIMETFYDENDEDEDSTMKPKPTETLSSSSQTTTANSESTTQASSSIESQSQPQTNSVSRDAKSRQVRSMRKRISGTMPERKTQLDESESTSKTQNEDDHEKVNDDLLENDDLLILRLMESGHVKSRRVRAIKKRISGRISDAKTQLNESESTSTTQNEDDHDKITDDLLRNDDLSIPRSMDSYSSKQSSLLKILISQIEENEKLEKQQQRYAQQQKLKSKEKDGAKYDLILKLLEMSWKNTMLQQIMKPKSPKLSQKVIISLSNNKASDPKPEQEPKEELKCKADETNYITCIKDKVVYETIKLNPADHSGIRKVEENIRYSTVKKPDLKEQAIKKVFPQRYSYMEQEDKAYQPYPQRHQPYQKDDYMRDQERFHRRPTMDLSSRFSPDENENENAEATTSVRSAETTTLLPIAVETITEKL
ncbi:hypothetical protein FQA39_LY09343 [Lamprigera yunnana]|nr:hypothetical protein FQA39_LY09343 [Lamprigera yunnana]